MGTRLQKKLANVIANEDFNKRPKDAGKLLEIVGYAKTTARAKPGEILRQKGVKEELRVLGFSEIEADSVVTKILHNEKIKPDTRLKASDLIYKRLGSYSPEKHDVRQLIVQISEEIAEKNEINANAITSSKGQTQV